MSNQPKRFDPIIDDDGLPAMDQFREGNYVLFSDYARLQDEVERLTIQGGDSEPRFVLFSEYQHIKALLAFATTKYCRLEADVERLQMAGDAMAGNLDRFLNESIADCDWLRDGLSKWNNAKDGNATK